MADAQQEKLEAIQFGERPVSLRDYFAAHCPITLTEWATGANATKSTIGNMLLNYSVFRYLYADEMLKARQS